MKHKLILLSVLLIAFACSQSNSDETAQNEVSDKNELQEYKASPLASLMRKIDAEMRVMREAIINNLAIPDSIDFNYTSIKTAEPTDPTVKTETFDAMAESFLINVADLKIADASERHKIFNQSIQSCVNCHGQFCPGPLVRIRKLPIPES